MFNLTKKENLLTYLPLVLNIFLDANFTVLGQEETYFKGEASIKEGNPFIKPILNTDVGRNWLLLYLFIIVYSSLTILLINKLRFNKRLSNLIYLVFWSGHFMGLSGWWFTVVANKILGNLGENIFIWFFSAIFLALVLTYCLYQFWITKGLKKDLALD
jgi:hypothetical protein